MAMRMQTAPSPCSLTPKAHADSSFTKLTDGKKPHKRIIAPRPVFTKIKERYCRGFVPNVDAIQQIILSHCDNWDPDEADCQSIAVEIGPDDNALIECSRPFREGIPEFASVASAPEVAAVSRSHLNLAMQAVRDGATTSGALRANGPDVVVSTAVD